MEAVEKNIPTPKRETEKPFLMPVEDTFSISVSVMRFLAFFYNSAHIAAQFSPSTILALFHRLSFPRAEAQW